MSRNCCPIQQSRFSRYFSGIDTDVLYSGLMSLVEMNGKRFLLEEIKGQCRRRHPWLKTEHEVELFALDCWAGRYYQKWKGA